MLTSIAQKLLSYQKADVFLPNFYSNAPSATFLPIKGCLGTERWGGLNFGGFPLEVKSSLVESGSSASIGIVFGTGTTPPTENDYTVENIISGLTLSATPTKQYSFDSATNKYTVFYDFTLANGTGEDITINEVCLFANVFPTSTKGENPGTGTSNKFAVLMDRTVLATPITIPANSSGVVRYSMIY